uniref:Uncharacterized protein n=1 Tax=Amphimedon queenslandica TaxID=400682 RepID=A0A1X7TWJ6_AMPQE
MEVITGAYSNVRGGVIKKLIPLEIDNSSGNNGTPLDVSIDNQESTIDESTANEFTVNSPRDSQQYDSTAVNDSNTLSSPNGHPRRTAAIQACDKINTRMC